MFMVRVRFCHRPHIFSRVRGAETEEEKESFLPEQDEVPRQTATVPAPARRKQQQHAVHDPLPVGKRDQTHLPQLPGSGAAGR